MTLGWLCGLLIVASADDAKLPTAVELLRIAESHRTEMKPSDDFCLAYFAVGEAEKALKEVGPTPGDNLRFPLIEGYPCYSRRTGKRSPAPSDESILEKEHRSASYIEGLVSQRRWREASLEFKPAPTAEDWTTQSWANRLICGVLLDHLLCFPNDSPNERAALLRRVIDGMKSPPHDKFTAGNYIDLIKCVEDDANRSALSAFAAKLDRPDSFFASKTAGLVWSALDDRMRAGASFRKAAAILECHCAASPASTSESADYAHVSFADYIGDIAARQSICGFRDEATRNFRHAIAAVSRIRDPIIRPWSLVDVAAWNAQAEDWTEAQRIIDSPRLIVGRSSAIRECAEIAFKKGRRDLADRWFAEAVSKTESINLDRLVWTLIDVGDVEPAQRVYRISYGHWVEQRKTDASLPTPSSFEFEFVRLLIARNAVDEAWKRLQRAKDWSKSDFATTYAKLSLAVAKRELGVSVRN